MEILEKFKEIVSNVENPTIIELGGCDGYHTNIMAKILSEKNKPFTYYVFEPVINLATTIKNTLNWCPYVEVIPKAISEKTGKFKFYQSDNKYYGSSSIRKPKLVYEFWSDMNFSETLCDCISLDDFMKEKGILGNTIDFIWADVQGAEKDLILGGKETFKNVRYFFTEFMEHEIYEGQIFDLNSLCSLIPQFSVEHKFENDILFKFEYDILLKNKNTLDEKSK